MPKSKKAVSEIDDTPTSSVCVVKCTNVHPKDLFNCCLCWFLFLVLIFVPLCSLRDRQQRTQSNRLLFVLVFTTTLTTWASQQQMILTKGFLFFLFFLASYRICDSRPSSFQLLYNRCKLQVILECFGSTLPFSSQHFLVYVIFLPILRSCKINSVIECHRKRRKNLFKKLSSLLVLFRVINISENAITDWIMCWCLRMKISLRVSRSGRKILRYRWRKTWRNMQMQCQMTILLPHVNRK